MHCILVVLLQFARSERTQCQVWRVCYCATYDVAGGTPANGYDNTGSNCDVKEEYTAQAGLLTLHGADGIGAYPCVLHVACTLDVVGTELLTSDSIQVTESARAFSYYVS